MDGRAPISGGGALGASGIYDGVFKCSAPLSFAAAEVQSISDVLGFSVLGGFSAQL